MIKMMKPFVMMATVMAFVFLSGSESVEAQVVPAYYPMPVTTVVTAKPRVFPRCNSYRPVVPVQVGYPAYFAPQVPVVPMSPVPVPTMSAYYVPTAPVVATYSAPVYPVRRVRYYSPSMVPAVVYPVYGY